MIKARSRAFRFLRATKNAHKRAACALFIAVAAPACNGQFDFDTDIHSDAEAGVPPIVVVDAGPEDVSSTSDTFVDVSRPRISISCGDYDCPTSGCCGKSSGFSCVDTAEGGTCGGLLIQCDDTDDCPAGQVCCAEGEDLNKPPCTSDVCTGSSRLLRVHCEPESRCKGDFVMLCNPDRPSPCSNCVASLLDGLPPRYHQCALGPSPLPAP